MKALITGIGGFVGSYLTEYLLSKGISVCGFDKQANEVKGAATYEADLLNEEPIFEIIKKEEPDIIFHLAGQSSVDKSFQIPELTMKINVDGTENVLKSIIKAGIKPKILVVSSAEVYGVPKELPLTEEHPLNPISPYALSRVQQEKLCLKYVKEKKMHIVVSRSFNHTGPKQPLPFVCPTITKQVAEIKLGRQEAIVEVGNPDIKRDFSDVRDVVKAYALAVEKGKKGEIYNICSGKSYSLSNIIEKLGRIIGRQIGIKVDATKTREKDISELRGDYGKFHRDTGWLPEIKVEKTLKDMVDYWVEEG